MDINILKGKKSYECSICGETYLDTDKAKNCCQDRKNREELDNQNKC